MVAYILFINGRTADRFRAKDEDDAKKYMLSIKAKHVFAISVKDAYRSLDPGEHTRNYIYPKED